MKNVLLVFTGGTIGSQLAHGTIDTDAQAGYRLLQLFRQQANNSQEIFFETLQPLQILSENLHPTAWPTLIAAIENEDVSRFDGIIITHGTDTLAFSAALLSLYFHRLPIPMLLVSSDLPLENPAANGLANFICACEFIHQRIAPGVFVPYRNPGQSMLIHHGSRLNACLPLSSDFISVQNQALMKFTDEGFVPLVPWPQANIANHWRLQAKFARVLLIKPYPGLNYDALCLDQFDVVLHDLYHSGTACVTEAWGKQHSLLAFASRCQQADVPLYLAPALYSDSAYSSTRELIAHGVNMIWNTSLESAYAKLSLAYGNFNDREPIDALLFDNLAGEKLAAA